MSVANEGTHSDVHLTPVKEELLATRQLLYIHWLSKSLLKWKKNRFFVLLIAFRLDFRSLVSGYVSHREEPSGRSAGSFTKQRLLIEPTLLSKYRTESSKLIPGR